MSKLTIIRGVPGCGKSTWAEAQAGNPVIVSRDRIRAALFGTADQDYYKVAKEVLRSREDLVTEIQNSAIAAGLAGGHHVIVDNTSTRWPEVRTLADIGFKTGAEVEVKVFDVPLSVAVERNAARAAAGGRDVPFEAIKRMHDALQSNKHMTLEMPNVPKPYHGTPGKPIAFMVDIDGTLAHMRDYRGPFDWAKVGLDDPDEVVVDIVNNLASDPSVFNVIVMSGRDESCRKETEDWLLGLIHYDELFMRPAGDMRKDSIVKAELFDQYVRDNFDVKFVLDDRNQVVDMWRGMGIKCLQVEDGPF